MRSRFLTSPSTFTSTTRQTFAFGHTDEDKLAVKAKIALDGNDGWIFRQKRDKLILPRDDARSSDRIPRDNQNAANTAHKWGRNCRNNRSQNNTMGDNAANDEHNLSPGGKSTPRIKFLVGMK